LVGKDRVASNISVNLGQTILLPCCFVIDRVLYEVLITHRLSFQNKATRLLLGPLLWVHIHKIQ
jgi:hypothetical protein